MFCGFVESNYRINGSWSLAAVDYVDVASTKQAKKKLEPFSLNESISKR